MLNSRAHYQLPNFPEPDYFPLRLLRHALPRVRNKIGVPDPVYYPELHVLYLLDPLETHPILPVGFSCVKPAFSVADR